MEFVQLADTLDKVSQTSKRKEKVIVVSEFMRQVDIKEIEYAALFLAGRIFPENSNRSLNISWNGLLNALKDSIEFRDCDLHEYYKGDVGEAIAELLSSKQFAQQSVLFHDALTIERVYSMFMKIGEVSGSGSVKEKQSIIRSLFADASSREARYLTALILNDMRTGLSEGLLVECIAEAYSIDSELVRRAWSFTGNIGEVARIASSEGAKALRKISIRIMTPVKPMLASPIDNLKTALELDPLAFEIKLDGARVQIHKAGDKVRIFTRRLNDVTYSMPDIAKIIHEKIRPKQIILDGEVIAIAEDGTPYPFQVVMRRFGRTQDIEEARREIQLRLKIFDILLLGDKMTIDLPYIERRKLLEDTIDNDFIVENLITRKIEEAERFFNSAKTKGHEGIIGKKLDSPYILGIRGRNWVKIKHALETLDLVIIAAERGHGRRNRWYSDYHLAVWDEERCEYAMVGKTFKGLTDDEFEKMTKKLKQIQVSQERGIIRVRPEVVVEVLASEIQESTNYKSGMALRFARIVNIRPEKGPDDVTKLSELRSIFDNQFRFKAR